MNNLTYLAGRYIAINVYPLSFKEYKLFKTVSLENEQIYSEFLKSSFPGVVLTNDNQIASLHQRDIFESIFQRDIIKGKITDENLFFNITRFILEHISLEIAPKRITNMINASRIKISYEKVTNFINLLLKSYFLYECKRYDVIDKSILKTLPKYYVVDFGIRNQLNPRVDTNTGRVLENFVFLELIKAGFEVYTGKVGRDFEIDFVAKKGNDILYVQVPQSILDENTRQREERPFKIIDDKHPRIIVTLDRMIFESDYYTHFNLFDFIDFITK